MTEGHPWVSVSGTVADLGGPHGGAAFALVRGCSDRRLIIQDLPPVIADPQRKQGTNVGFITHDFFNKQPMEGSGMCYSRWTLYNWPEIYCLHILKVLKPVLKTGALLLGAAAWRTS